MKFSAMHINCLGLLLLLASTPVCAADEDPSPAASSQPAELTVAVLDFAAGADGEADLGAQISEVLTAMLSGEPGLKLVERASLQRVLREQELNLSGIVATTQAVQVGRLVGARIMIVGKAFSLGQQTFITAKIIGTETSLVDGVLVRGDQSAAVGDLVFELAAKLNRRLREVGPHLTGDAGASRDPLPRLKSRLANRVKPTIAVVIPEQHLSRPAPIPDPAVETEIKKLLIECGFQVQDVEANALADFARDHAKHDPDSWPRQLRNADVIIVGEGMSEFAARIGNLVSCVARAEVNVISRRSGEVLLAARATERAVDLSENIAGKSSLQKAGRTIGIQVLSRFADTLEPKQP